MDIKEIIESAFFLVVIARGMMFIFLIGKRINPNHIILFPEISRPIYGKPPYNTNKNSSIESITLPGTLLFAFDLVFYMLFDPITHTILCLSKSILCKRNKNN